MARNEGHVSSFVDPSRGDFRLDFWNSVASMGDWQRWGISADALAVLLSGAALGAHEAARISHRSLSAAAKREKNKACGVAQLVVRMHKLVSFECRIKHDLAAANL